MAHGHPNATEYTPHAAVLWSRAVAKAERHARRARLHDMRAAFADPHFDDYVRAVTKA